MRKCKTCGRRQTTDPTALPKVVAAVNGFCLCWYEASEKLRKQQSERDELVRILPALREEMARRVAEGMDDAQAEWAKATAEEVALVEYMEQVAPVHLLCNVEGCTLCAR